MPGQLSGVLTRTNDASPIAVSALGFNPSRFDNMVNVLLVAFELEIGDSVQGVEDDASKLVDYQVGTDGYPSDIRDVILASTDSDGNSLDDDAVTAKTRIVIPYLLAPMLTALNGFARTSEVETYVQLDGTNGAENSSRGTESWGVTFTIRQAPFLLRFYEQGSGTAVVTPPKASQTMTINRLANMLYQEDKQAYLITRENMFAPISPTNVERAGAVKFFAPPGIDVDVTGDTRPTQTLEATGQGDISFGYAPPA